MTSPRAHLSIWVVLPTYNGSAHLREQLDSIQRQVRLPDGLVASDDGSDDDSACILEDFAATAPFPVTVQRQPHNVGLLSNLESTLTLALTAADVIAFADQDDVWHPDKLASVEGAFADPTVLLWFSDAEFIDSAGRPYGTRLWQAMAVDAEADMNSAEQLGRFVVGETITGTAMAARTSLVRSAMPFPRTTTGAEHHFLHDGWLGLLAHLRGGIVLEGRPLTSYRQHENQFTGMSLLHSASAAPQARRKSVDAGPLLDEADRLSAIEEHLRQPEALSFLGGELPQHLLDRIRFTSTRAAVVRGHEHPGRLLGLRPLYDEYADGWQTLLVDWLRWLRTRSHAPATHDAGSAVK